MVRFVPPASLLLKFSSKNVRECFQPHTLAEPSGSSDTIPLPGSLRSIRLFKTGTHTRFELDLQDEEYSRGVDGSVIDSLTSKMASSGL